MRPFQAQARCTRVLMVEDDPAQRESIRSILEPQLWRITEAENGRVALDRLTVEAPDIILLDLMMPEMDGFELVTVLRERPEWRGIPVIVITAFDLTARRSQAAQFRRRGHFVEELVRSGPARAIRSPGGG